MITLDVKPLTPQEVSAPNATDIPRIEDIVREINAYLLDTEGGKITVSLDKLEYITKKQVDYALNLFTQAGWVIKKVGADYRFTMPVVIPVPVPENPPVTGAGKTSKVKVETESATANALQYLMNANKRDSLSMGGTLAPVNGLTDDDILNMGDK